MPVERRLPGVRMDADDQVDLLVAARRGRSCARSILAATRTGCLVVLAGDLVVGGGEQHPHRPVGAQARAARGHRRAAAAAGVKGSPARSRPCSRAAISPTASRSSSLVSGTSPHALQHCAERPERIAAHVLDQRQRLRAQTRARAATTRIRRARASSSATRVEDWRPLNTSEHVGCALVQQAVEREAGDQPAVDVAAHPALDRPIGHVDVVGAEVRLHRGAHPFADTPLAVCGASAAPTP